MELKLQIRIRDTNGTVWIADQPTVRWNAAKHQFSYIARLPNGLPQGTYPEVGIFVTDEPAQWMRLPRPLEVGKYGVDSVTISGDVDVDPVGSSRTSDVLQEVARLIARR